MERVNDAVYSEFNRALEILNCSADWRINRETIEGIKDTRNGIIVPVVKDPKKPNHFVCPILGGQLDMTIQSDGYNIMLTKKVKGKWEVKVRISTENFSVQKCSEGNYSTFAINIGISDGKRLNKGFGYVSTCIASDISYYDEKTDDRDEWGIRISNDLSCLVNDKYREDRNFISHLQTRDEDSCESRMDLYLDDKGQYLLESHGLPQDAGPDMHRYLSEGEASLAKLVMLSNKGVKGRIKLVTNAITMMLPNFASFAKKSPQCFIKPDTEFPSSYNENLLLNVGTSKKITSGLNAILTGDIPTVSNILKLGKNPML